MVNLLTYQSTQCGIKLSKKKKDNEKLMIYCTSIRIFSVITLGLDINLIKVFILQTPINYNHHYILFYGSRKGGGGTRNNFIFRRFTGMFLGLFLLILLVCDFNNFNIPRGIRTYHHLPTSSRSAHAYRASMPKQPPDYFIDID